MTLSHLLDGLRCAHCLTPDALWLDPVRSLAECRECGQTALTITATNEGRSL